jgi:hypothetical protein
MEDPMNDIPTVRAPMILPWLAHKAGIDERRAETLWLAARRYASTHHGLEAETPAYWKAAMDRLLELIAAESLREDNASFGWRPWLRAQSRCWETPVALWDALAQPYIRGWRQWNHEHLPSC